MPMWRKETSHTQLHRMNHLCRFWRWSKWLLQVVGLTYILVISTPLVSWWARLYSGPLQQPTGDVLILLSAAGDDEGVISFSSYWRARYAVLAWRTGRYKQIVVTGGGPGIANFLMAEGIPRGVITADTLSPSTHQSGITMAQLLGGSAGKKVVVTSDYHIYRAVRVFRRCGLTVDPMPVPDVQKLGDQWNGRIQGFQIMLVESAKIAYYRIHGWM